MGKLSQHGHSSRPSQEFKGLTSVLNDKFKKYRNANHTSDSKTWQVSKGYSSNGLKIRLVQKSANSHRGCGSIEQRKSLPVYLVKDQIVSAVKKHATLILIGETASGKTTQIPQFIYESCVHGNKVIAITQPRRIAAVTVASRVAAEMSTMVGETVGYSVRFEEKTSPKTRIKFMTDGMLLREAIVDPLLQKYSVVILDEAHERSVQTDVLMGIVKRCQVLRAEEGECELKIIVMSATMDVDHFSKYFNSAPVYYLEGRLHPIKTLYLTSPEDDYVQTALVTVLQIHREESDGDILVFCTGAEEINSMVTAIKSATVQMPPGLMKLIPYAIHATLPTSEQLRVFQPSIKGSTRKVIFATNVAETSITIPGVKFVVDTCRVKQRKFESATGFEILKVQFVSQAQAQQRAGRAGREGPGTCYRLITESQFKQLKQFTVPEILRVNLSNVALYLIAIGINDISTFDFMDKPKQQSTAYALTELQSLCAIEPASRESSFKLTSLGNEMVKFPLDPRFSRILVASKDFNCTEEIITIVSMLYIDSIFYFPPNKRELANEIMKKFSSPEGDHVMLLNVFKAFQGSKCSKEWCYDNFIHMKNMDIVRDVRKQLIRIWETTELPRRSAGSDSECIRQCLFQGLRGNIAILQKDGTYQTFETKEQVFIHPSSCLFGSKPEVVIYTELVDTNKKYMRNISLVSGDWISSQQPHSLDASRPQVPVHSSST